MRKTQFANEEFYHIYNRGVDKREVFLDEWDYERFLKSMKEFNGVDPIGSLYEKSFKDAKSLLESKSPIGDLDSKSSKSVQIVEFVSYCLNPNHYHFIIKQTIDGGIAKFMQKIGIAYTMYFNKKYSRSGSLFQGTFKSIHIDSNEYLLYLSAYVNKNNFIHNYNDVDWKYSSLAEYRKENNQKINICNTAPILDQFDDKEEYVKFLNDNASYLKNKKDDEKYLLED